MELSVLIPTRGRPRLLTRCLAHLAEQESPPTFEVVVSINGDEDYAEADLDALRDRIGYPLTVVRSPEGRQAAAVNGALEAAQGDLVLLIGDDIFAGPRLLERHVARHRALDDYRTAVQGKVSWHPELLPDRFLEWETEEGIQFAFGRMEEHVYVPLRFLYTCNVSLRREWLKELGGLDGSLPSWMDTVFSFEGGKRGLKLFYDPDASAYHHDRWTLERVCRRRYEKGRTAARLLEEDPAFAEHVLIPEPGLWRTMRYAVSRAVRAPAERAGWRRIMGWCWIHAIHYHFTRGLAEARRESLRS